MFERFGGKLPPTVLARYEEAIEPDIAEQYEQALAEIIRFAGLIPHTEGFVHTVLDHKISGVEWIAEVAEKYPSLAQAVDTDDAVSMFLLHDAGEMFGGDMRRDDPEYTSNRSQKKKRYQFLSVLLGLLNIVEDDSHREVMKSYYRRFESQTGEDSNGHLRAMDTNDITALFARLIDIMQGNYIAVTEYFSFNLMEKDRLTPEYIKRRLTIMLKETTAIYQRLLTLLPQEAGIELSEWWKARMAEYVEQGYPEKLLEVETFSDIEDLYHNH